LGESLKEHTNSDPQNNKEISICKIYRGCKLRI